MFTKPVPNLHALIDLTILGDERAWIAKFAQLHGFLVKHPHWGRRVALHLRIKNERSDARLKLGAQAVDVAVSTPRYAHRVVWNGTLAEAQKLGLPNLHLPEAELWRSEVLANAGHRVGASVHSLRAQRRAETLGLDYTLFGPVLAPGSKPAGGIGWHALRAHCSQARLPVVAVGGLQPTHLAHCRRAGAHGVAVLSGIVAAPDATQALANYLESLQAWQKPANQ